MKLWNDKLFLKSMLSIAVPIALQSLISSSLNMVDTLMTSSLGQTSLAAVGLANQIFFFYILITFGIGTGSSTFMAQYWGKGDILSIRKVMGLATVISTAVGVIFTIGAGFFPEYLMRFFIDSPATIQIGSDYLRIVSLSYIITAISFILNIGFRNTENSGVPLKASIIVFFTNAILNYVFMFGKLGFPEMGVKGAALGTLIARIIEIIMLLYSAYASRGPLAASFGDLFGWEKEFLKKYMKTASPVVINEGFWSLGQVLYAVAYAKIGEQATATVQIVSTIQNIFFVIVRGLANSSTVMIGNKIGEGDEDGAYEYAIKFLYMSTIVGLLLGLLMIFSADFTLKIFRGLDANLYKSAKSMLVVIGAVLFVKTFNSTAIVGVFRGGGDTTFSMLLEMGSVWLVGVPLAFLGAMVFKLPVHLVVALVCMEDVTKAIIAVPRIISKKWIQNVT